MNMISELKKVAYSICRILLSGLLISAVLVGVGAFIILPIAISQYFFDEKLYQVGSFLTMWVVGVAVFLRNEDW